MRLIWLQFVQSMRCMQQIPSHKVYEIEVNEKNVKSRRRLLRKIAKNRILFYCLVNKARAKWWFVQINLAIYSLSRTRICRCPRPVAGYFRNSIWILLVWGQWHTSSYYTIDTFLCVRSAAACDINFVIFIILVWFFCRFLSVFSNL